jgi:hypothetical protein
MKKMSVGCTSWAKMQTRKNLGSSDTRLWSVCLSPFFKQWLEVKACLTLWVISDRQRAQGN